MWHFLLVDVANDRRVRRSTQLRKGCGDLVFLDQATRLFDGLGRAIAIVVGDKVDLAAGEAALLVRHPECRRDRLADDAVGRGGTAVRYGVPDANLGCS